MSTATISADEARHQIAVKLMECTEAMLACLECDDKLYHLYNVCCSDEVLGAIQAGKYASIELTRLCEARGILPWGEVGQFDEDGDLVFPTPTTCMMYSVLLWDANEWIQFLWCHADDDQVMQLWSKIDMLCGALPYFTQKWVKFMESDCECVSMGEEGDWVEWRNLEWLSTAIETRQQFQREASVFLRGDKAL
jgi:hypothetical protein